VLALTGRKRETADLTGIRQRGARFQVRIFGGTDPATGKQLILTGSAATEADALALRDGFRNRRRSPRGMDERRAARAAGRVAGRSPGRAEHPRRPSLRFVCARATSSRR